MRMPRSPSERADVTERRERTRPLLLRASVRPMWKNAACSGGRLRAEREVEWLAIRRIGVMGGLHVGEDAASIAHGRQTALRVCKPCSRRGKCVCNPRSDELVAGRTSVPFARAEPGWLRPERCRAEPRRHPAPLALISGSPSRCRLPRYNLREMEYGRAASR